MRTKQQAAVSALAGLAELSQYRGYKHNRPWGTPVTVEDLSDYTGFSVSYLEQLFAYLRRAGLVTGVRGPGGGYALARPCEGITVTEVLRAVGPDESDSTLDPIHARLARDVFHRRLEDVIHKRLESVTVSQLLVP